MENKPCYSTQVGYIYALYLNNKPFYIGQTKKAISLRYKQHKYSFFKEKYLYKYLRSIISIDEFYNRVKIKPLKLVKLTELNYYEIKYIKYCLDKKIPIYNNCCKTISYVISKYGITLEEYNNLLNKQI